MCYKISLYYLYPSSWDRKERQSRQIIYSGYAFCFKMHGIEKYRKMFEFHAMLKLKSYFIYIDVRLYIYIYIMTIAQNLLSGFFLDF